MYLDLQFGQTLIINGTVEYFDHYESKTSDIPAELKVSNKSFQLSYAKIVHIQSIDLVKELHVYTNSNDNIDFYICGTNFKCSMEQFNQLLKVIL